MSELDKNYSRKDELCPGNYPPLINRRLRLRLILSLCLLLTESLPVAVVTSTPGSFQITEVLSHTHTHTAERLGSKTWCLTQKHSKCVFSWPGSWGHGGTNMRMKIRRWNTHTNRFVCVSQQLQWHIRWHVALLTPPLPDYTSTQSAKCCFFPSRISIIH